MKQRFFHFITGILFTLLFLNIGLCFVLFFRPFYYFEIEHLSIVKTSGYSAEEIKANYDALIDYSSPFYHGSLTFPTFSASKEGLLHFAEVKDLFFSFFIVGLASFFLLLLIHHYKKRAKDYHYLRSSALFVLILPLVVMLAAAINFDATFTLFHNVFFRNEYWVFDPDTDPVIKILPQQFFYDAAAAIALFILAGALLLEGRYRYHKKNASRAEKSQR